MKKIFLLFFAGAFVGCVSAHQPRLVFDQPVEQVVNVQNPEVSQAFYGILSGQEDIYQIISDTGFLLYVNIVVPKIYGSRTDFTVDIIEGNTAVYTRLDGKVFTWTDFFEPFAGDSYLQGPSLEKQVGSGIYTIRVANPGNQGKYSLAIGKKEAFSIKEIVHTYKILPTLKMVFFEKPRYSVIGNTIVISLLVILLALILVFRGVRKIIKHKRYKK